MNISQQDFMSRQQQPKPFTLIEILVVVAIIGILSSLLLPALGKAREKGQIAVCTNNMKQLNTATVLYMDDSNGYFPVTIGGASGISWDDLLSAYDGRNLTDAQITGWPGQNGLLHMNVPEGPDHAPMYRCPLDDRILTNTAFILKTYDISHYQVGSGERRGISGFDGIIAPISRSLSEISKTSNTIVYAENHAPVTSDGGGTDFRSRIGNSWYFNGLWPQLTELNLAKHSDMKFNFAMADGHVQKMTNLQSLIRTDGTVTSASDTADSKWDAGK